MKALKILALISLFVTVPVLAGSDKPVVFISGSGNISVATDGVGSAGRVENQAVVGGSSTHGTISKHDQTMEMANILLKSCPGIEVTLDEKAQADYTVALNREGQPTMFGEMGKSEVMVVNAKHSPIFVSKTQTVKNAVKQACSVVLADWQANGRLALPEPVKPVELEPANPPNKDNPAKAEAPAAVTHEYDVAVVIHTTERARERCKPETISALVADMPAYLQSKGYVVGPAGKAEVVVTITIDRPMSKWVELSIHVETAAGKALLDEKVSDGGWGHLGTKGLENTLTQVHKLLDEKLPPVVAP